MFSAQQYDCEIHLIFIGSPTCPRITYAIKPISTAGDNSMPCRFYSFKYALDEE